MTLATAHEFGDSLAEYHRMRYRLFIEQEGWDVPSFGGLEYDEFDTPATVYLIKRSEPFGPVQGGIRLYPTSQPYMIEKIWPDLIQGRDLPKSPLIWEGSRMSPAPELDVPTRRAVLDEIGAAMFEFLQDHGVTNVLFQMPPKLFEFWAGGDRENYELLGPPITLPDGEELVGGWVKISEMLVRRAKKKIDATRPLLVYPRGDIPYRRAA
ncbi:hypothetical protein JYU02_01640 [bacterium AH-315-P15]|nr:hypothetical protein [bacterium AH-315-P15]